MTIIVVATRNPGKMREMREVLPDGDIEWRTLAEYPHVVEPEETGTTFAENAVLKARYYREATGEAILAEDSGLEVAVLGGAPGVYSARYAGEPSNDDANNQKLLDALRDVPDTERGARFVSVVAVALPDGRVETAAGTVAGRIAHACAGHHGFGYDAVFIPEGYDATFGVLSPEVKRVTSHRMRALRAMLPRLPHLLGVHAESHE